MPLIRFCIELIVRNCHQRKNTWKLQKYLWTYTRKHYACELDTSDLYTFELYTCKLYTCKIYNCTFYVPLTFILNRFIFRRKKSDTTSIMRILTINTFDLIPNSFGMSSAKADFKNYFNVKSVNAMRKLRFSYYRHEHKSAWRQCLLMRC